MNARSRLNPKIQEDTSLEKRRGRTDTATTPYLKHIPLLVLAILSYLSLFQVINNNYPNDIAHFLLPNAFFLFLLPLFFGNFFLLSYLTLNVKRGFVLAFFINLLVFFKLQQITFEVWWIVPLTLITILATIFAKKH